MVLMLFSLLYWIFIVNYKHYFSQVWYLEVKYAKYKVERGATCRECEQPGDQWTRGHSENSTREVTQSKYKRCVGVNDTGMNRSVQRTMEQSSITLIWTSMIEGFLLRRQCSRHSSGEEAVPQSAGSRLVAPEKEKTLYGQRERERATARSTQTAFPLNILRDWKWRPCNALGGFQHQLASIPDCGRVGEDAFYGRSWAG